MKVCLVLPPRLYVKGYFAPSAHPPLGLALIAGVLIEAGHEVTVIDAIGLSPDQINEVSPQVNSELLPNNLQLLTLGLSVDEIADRIPADTNVIGFSCMFTFNWLADRDLINKLSVKFPSATFIAGGESITGSPEQCLQQCSGLNICVLGEGEETIVDLLNKMENSEDFNSVGSIVYKLNGDIIKTPRRARLKNIDDIPFPAWELFPVNNYQMQKRSPDSSFVEVSLGILATRGCPYTCTFCTSPDMWGTRYYMRKPENVVAEMEYLKEKFNATIFDFYDLTAIIQKKWIMEFTELLIAKNLNFAWRIPAGTRSEAIDDEVAHNLRKSGCYSITYAPESGSPRLLKLIHKKVKLDNILLSMKDSEKNDMIIQINMILGLPDETHLDILKTLIFLIKCSWVGVKQLNLHLFRPYPGSSLFGRLLKEQKIQVQNDDYLVDSLLIIVSAREDTCYNSNISYSWYKFYNKFILSVFYISGYIFRPSTVFKSFKNITSKNYQNHLEEALSVKYERLRSSFKIVFSKG